MTRWPVEPLTFSKKNPSRAIPRSTYIHPPSLAKIGQRTSEEIGNKQTDRQTDKRCSIYSMILFHEDFSSIIGIFLSWSVESPNLFEVTKYLHHTLVICYSVFLVLYSMCDRCTWCYILAPLNISIVLFVYMFVFSMQCSCQPTFHVCNNKGPTYLLIKSYLVMGRSVGQTLYSTLPRTTQLEWVPCAQIQGWVSSCRLHWRPLYHEERWTCIVMDVWT